MSRQTLIELIIMVTGAFILLAGKKIPAILRNLAEGLREFNGGSGYVEIER